MGFWSNLSDEYEAFKSGDNMSSSRDFFRHHPGNISMDTNQAGHTMESRHQVSKDLIMYTAVPGGGKMVYTIGRSLLGKVSGKHVLKVIWPLMLTDYPGHYKLGRLAALIEQFERSPGQDATSASEAGQGPKTPGGTKPPGASSGNRKAQTLKPFWSNGKPKCPKGFRYDFKRKMCVKKS